MMSHFVRVQLVVVFKPSTIKYPADVLGLILSRLREVFSLAAITERSPSDALTRKLPRSMLRRQTR